MTPKIPEKLELKGKIVTLRSLPQPESHQAMQKILSDPKTMQNLLYMAHQPKGWTMEQVEERYRDFCEDAKKEKGIHFIVYSNETNEVLGNCGYTHLSLSHRFGRSGRIIHHPYWGRRIGTECNLLTWEYGIEKLGLHRIEFSTFDDNVRVLKGAESLGIAVEGIQRENFYENGRYRNSYLYVFFDRDWPKIKGKLQDKIKKQSGRG